jgi:hypothetical protein
MRKTTFISQNSTSQYGKALPLVQSQIDRITYTPQPKQTTKISNRTFDEEVFSIFFYFFRENIILKIQIKIKLLSK